jgi:SAM-dependent methyltransferase
VSNPDLTGLAENLVCLGSGLWSSQAISTVSFPSDGSDRMGAVEADSFWFCHRNQCIVNVVRRFLTGREIWDIGGGNGVVSLALKEAGLEVVLLEPGPEAIQRALARGLPTVVRATMADAGFRPHSLPAAGLFDVLEHIADDVAFLRRLQEVLRPGGELFLTVPAHRYLWSTNDQFSGHFRRYSARRLRRALNDSGFEIRFLTYFFAPLVLPILLFRALPSSLGLRPTIEVEHTIGEHRRRSGPMGSLLSRCLTWEQRRIAQGRRLPVGSSLLVAATARG